MNKSELIDSVNSTGLFPSRAAAERATTAVINSMSAGIKTDGNLQLVGFGSFSVVKRKKRNGRNPQTGETIKIKASKSVRFRPGLALKESVKRTKV